jgi:hypothetical protein
MLKLSPRVGEGGLVEKQEKKEFDLKTHVRDKNTGEVVGQNHYVYRVSKAGEYYERGGKKYAANGEPLEQKAPEAAPAPEPQPVAAKPKEEKKPAKSKAQQALEKAADQKKEKE